MKTSLTIFTRYLEADRLALRTCAVLFCFFSTLVFAGEEAATVLLSNGGAKQSSKGPDMLGDACVMHDDLKSASVLDNTPKAGSTYGAIGFPEEAYDPKGSVIEFDYRPMGDEGSLIFVIGGDFSNGNNPNMLALYKHHYSEGKSPALSVSSRGSSWEYLTEMGASGWQWDPEKWYHIKVEFQIRDRHDDFARVSVDGKPFMKYNGDANRRLDAKLAGPIWFGGYREESYGNTPGRFANIKITKLPAKALADSTPEVSRWKMAGNPDELVIESSEGGPQSPPADLTLRYHKRNARYYDGPAFHLDWKPQAPLDLSNAKRFSGRFEAQTAHGYYSGRTYLVLKDKNGVEAEFLINKEYFNARGGQQFEVGLYSYPAGFDPQAVQQLQLRVYIPNHPHEGRIAITGLHFDDHPPGEVEAHRRKEWQKRQAAQPGDFALHPVHATAKVLRDQMEEGSPSEIILNAGSGGTDDFQVVVMPGGQSREPVRVRLEGLKQENGEMLNAAARFYEVVWMPTLPAQRDATFEGYYPDLLKPLKADSLPLTPERVSALWSEIAIPKDAKPGTYRGQLVFERGKTTTPIPVTVTVHNLVIPVRPSFATAFWLHMPDLAKRLGKPEGQFPTFAEAKPWIDIALENRVTPTWFGEQHFTVAKDPDTGRYKVDLSRLVEFSNYVMAHGGTVVDAGGGCWFGPMIYNSPQWIFSGFPGEDPADKASWIDRAVPEHRRQILDEYVRTLRAAAVQGGWEKSAYFQPWDEPNEDARQHHLQVVVPELASSIAQNWPEARLAMTVGVPPNLAPLVTMPVPTIPVVDNPRDGGRGWSAEARAAGKSPWFYSCVSYGITIAENGIRDRLVPLHAFDGGADGYLFWGLNKFWTVDEKTLRLSEVSNVMDAGRSPYGCNSLFGDGYLVYPDPEDESVLYPSLRLKAFRSGMEDYEFAKRLRDLSKRKEVDPKLAALAAEVLGQLKMALYYDAWEKPETVNAFRAQAGAAINAIEAQLSKSKP